MPPDLLPQIGRYFAILRRSRTGWTAARQPTAQAGQAALQARMTHAQCLAAKNLSINVNPQYGAYDYATFSVVPAPSKLAAARRSARARPRAPARARSRG